MQKQNLNKRDLDAIGRKLVASTRAAGLDVDQIVSNPHLYDAVRARISTDTAATPIEQASRSGFARHYAAAAAVMAVLLVASVALLRAPNNNSNSLTAVVVEQVPEVIPVSQARPDHPPKPMFRKLPSGRASQNPTKAKASQPLTKKTEQKLRTQPVHQPEGEFYALSFAGDLEETAAGGRIIRVDMPRSSLFAMGVNIPLENGGETVKTDLLIGSDGMTRAVRIVE